MAQLRLREIESQMRERSKFELEIIQKLEELSEKYQSQTQQLNVVTEQNRQLVKRAKE